MIDAYLQNTDLIIESDDDGNDSNPRDYNTRGTATNSDIYALLHHFAADVVNPGERVSRIIIAATNSDGLYVHAQEDGALTQLQTFHTGHMYVEVGAAIRGAVEMQFHVFPLIRSLTSRSRGTDGCWEKEITITDMANSVGFIPADWTSHYRRLFGGRAF